MRTSIRFVQDIAIFVSKLLKKSLKTGGEVAKSSYKIAKLATLVSSNPEELDYLDQVCLIRVGAKLCRAVALQELSRPVL